MPYAYAPYAEVPVIVTLPAPVAEILDEFFKYTPKQSDPVAQEVPLTVSVPVLVVTVEPLIMMLRELPAPFATVPVMITLPVSVAEMFDEESR